MTKIPEGMYAEEHDGMLDPANPGNRFSMAQRLTNPPERLVEEQDRREALSPVTRALQRAADHRKGRTR